MWILVAQSILPIFIALTVGWMVGNSIKEKLRHRCVRLIGLLVWLMLVAIGVEFGAVLLTPHLGFYIVTAALSYALVLSVTTFFLVHYAITNKETAVQREPKQFKDILAPIKACMLAVLMVLAGVMLYIVLPEHSLPSQLSSYLLYCLIFLIGIDLSAVQLGRLTGQHVLVPSLVIVAWLVSALVMSLLLNESTATLLMVGSGFGWFSLSAPLITQLTDAKLGSFALLSDLFRELFAIMLLYLFGQQHAKSAIAVCGATAMDSTLPFVKKNCSPIDVQIAIFSGFVLTVLAPFIVVLCAYLR